MDKKPTSKEQTIPTNGENTTPDKAVFAAAAAESERRKADERASEEEARLRARMAMVFDNP